MTSYETPKPSSPFPVHNLKNILAGKELPKVEKRAPGTRTPLTEAELRKHYPPEVAEMYLKRRALEEDLRRINEELNAELARLGEEGEDGIEKVA